MLTKTKVEKYVAKYGLPQLQQHAFKHSGLSLQEYINYNYMHILGGIMTKQYLNQQEQKQIEQNIAEEITKAIEDIFK